MHNESHSNVFECLNINCVYINEYIEWKQAVSRYTVELQTNKLKGTREDVIKVLRSEANNIHTEVKYC